MLCFIVCWISNHIMSHPFSRTRENISTKIRIDHNLKFWRFKERESASCELRTTCLIHSSHFIIHMIYTSFIFHSFADCSIIHIKFHNLDFLSFVESESVFCLTWVLNPKLSPSHTTQLQTFSSSITQISQFHIWCYLMNKTKSSLHHQHRLASWFIKKCIFSRGNIRNDFKFWISIESWCHE